MTSKISSSERGLLDAGFVASIIRRHMWLPVLALIGFILAMPVVTMIACENNLAYNMYNGDVEAHYLRLVEDIHMVQQFLVSAIIMVGAVMAGSTMFRYLHVRRQVDFYHSLPVRREKFFVSNLLAGLMVFLAPYLVSVVLNLLMLAVNGLMPYVALGDMAQWIVFNVLAYLLFLACTTFAMMLSGTLPSALKVLTCIFFLAPAAGLVLEGLGGLFYDRWFSLSEAVNQVLIRASVVVRYVMLSDAGMVMGMDGVGLPVWQDWLVAVLLTAGLLSLSLVLYRKRASECAGQTLAFGWQKLPYKYPIVLLGGLCMAMFFYAVGNMRETWLYFGAVFGACFMAMLLEILIQNDFRAVRRGWKGAVAATVAVCAILSVYVFDMTGYDDRLPATDRIESVSVYSHVLRDAVGDRSYGGYYIAEDSEDTSEIYWRLDNAHDRYDMLDYSDPAEVAAVMALVNKSMEYEAGEAPVVSEDDAYTSEYDHIYLVYHLDNGSTMARVYHDIPAAECYDAYATLLGSDSFYQALAINNYDMSKVEVREVFNFCVNGAEYYWEPKWPSDEARITFLETMRRELTSLDPAQILGEYPVLEISLMSYKEKYIDEYTKATSYSETRYQDVYVYPGMTETLALLKEVIPDSFFRPIQLSDVLEVREYVYRGYDEDDQVKYYEGSAPAGTIVVETTSAYSEEYVQQAVYLPGRDDARIAEILAATIQEDLRYRGLPLYRLMEESTVHYELDYAVGSPEDPEGQTISTQIRWPKPVLEH